MVIVLMGVSGSGKTTVGVPLAQALGGEFAEGDDYHPPANIAKMRRGEPLTDADRWPWLECFARAMAARPGRVVGACSALRRAYRDRIRAEAGEPAIFVHLDGSRELIAARMAARTGHFMPASLLDSQLAALERPDAAEDAIVVDISGPADAVLDAIIAELNGRVA
jgi:gluconokinase